MRDKVVSVRVLLERLRELIDNLLMSTLLNSNPPVIDRLTTLLDQSCRLLNDTIAAQALDPELQRRITLEIPIAQQLVTDITATIVRMRVVQEAVSSASGGVRSSEEQITRSQELSLAATSNLDQIMVNLAVGNQNVTELARLNAMLNTQTTQAEASANQLNLLAQRLNSYAVNASSTATAARNTASQALGAARANAQSLQMLSTRLAGTTDFVAMANLARNAADPAYRYARSQLGDAQAPIINNTVSPAIQPASVVTGLVTQAAAHQAAAEAIQAASQNLRAYTAGNQTETQAFGSEVNASNSRAVAVRGRAQVAYDLSRTTANNVNNSVAMFTNRLEILRNFSEETMAVQRAARMALDTAAQLENRSTTDLNSANAVLSAHAGALANSAQAFGQSQQAVEISANASQVRT